VLVAEHGPHSEHDQSLSVHAGVQDWFKTGLPPVQLVGDDVATVLVCWPFVQAFHSEYVHEVHVGGATVHDCVKTGLPPAQPVGLEDVAVRVCWLSVHALQSE